MNRTILHSDCNCFYASVELLHHPELRGKPVAVGGDPEARHGIVLTADYTAKRYGVKTGMALWQAKEPYQSIYRSYIREAHRYHYQKLYKIHWHRGRLYRRASLHDRM